MVRVFFKKGFNGEDGNFLLEIGRKPEMAGWFCNGVGKFLFSVSKLRK